MKKAILGSLAVLPLAAAGMLANAGAASAAALTGQFNFSSVFTTAEISMDEVDFSAPGDIALALQTESFTAFDAAIISDIDLDDATANNPFLDLEASFPGSPGDGLNVFNLTSVGDYAFTQSGDNVAIDLSVFGQFVSADGMLSDGAGNLTFQVNNAEADDIEDLVLNQNGMVNASFSGAAFTTASVPEPATILGLGVVAGSLALTRAGKKNKA
jgi:hypothetical protein